MMKRITFTAIAALLAFSCTTPETKTEQEENLTAITETPEGLILLQTNCLVCHAAKADGNTAIAPSMPQVKQSYLAAYPKEADFVENISRFVQNPNEEASKMPAAVRKYGLMPKMSFTEAQIKAITTYLYQFDDFTKNSKNAQKTTPTGSYAEIGSSYAMQTKAILGKNLMKAIQEKGTDGALEFCHERAYPLTDSMSQALQVAIKRVSDKPRNPNNQANENELKTINTFKQQLAKGEKIMPIVQENEGLITAYYPIETNKMCLQCHGKALDDIKASTLEKIKEKYPQDQAKGYGENELRGIWVVAMKEK